MRSIVALCLVLSLIASEALADTSTRNPTADEAESGTWSGASAGTRYTLVDDHPDTTCSSGDRLLAGTAASEITFTGSAFSVPAGATINSVQVVYRDGKTATQGATARARLKVGGTYYANATTHNPGNGTCDARTDTWTQNPATSAAWTVDQVNGTAGSNQLQAFGVGCTDCSPTTYFGSVQLLVDYTPAPAACTGSVWTSTGVKNKTAANNVDSTTLTLSGLSTGSLIVVWTAHWDNAGSSTMAVSDGTNGSYSEAYYFVEAGQFAVGVHYFANNAAGSVTITGNPSGTGAASTLSLIAQEFCTASVPASPVSGTPTYNGGASLSTATVSPPDNDVLMVANFYYGGSVTLTQDGSWSLSDEDEAFSTSAVYKIISGAPGSVSHTWSAPGGSLAGIAAFKPTTGGAPAAAPGLGLLGVGR